MKKVSTAVAKQSRTFSQQKLTMGLDLGDRNSCHNTPNQMKRAEIPTRRTDSHPHSARKSPAPEHPATANRLTTVPDGDTSDST